MEGKVWSRLKKIAENKKQEDEQMQKNDWEATTDAEFIGGNE